MNTISFVLFVSPAVRGLGCPIPIAHISPTFRIEVVQQHIFVSLLGFVCIKTYTCTHAHAYVHTYMHAYSVTQNKPNYLQTYLDSRIFTYTNTLFMYTYIYLITYRHLYIHVCIYICVYVYMYICMYIHFPCLRGQVCDNSVNYTRKTKYVPVYPWCRRRGHHKGEGVREAVLGGCTDEKKLCFFCRPPPPRGA